MLSAPYRSALFWQGERMPPLILALGASLFVLHHVAAHITGSEPVGLTHFLLSGIAEWGPWFAATPIILWVVRRRGLHLPSDQRGILSLVAVGILLSLVAGSLEFWIRSLVPNRAQSVPAMTWGLFLQRGFAFDFAIYSALSLVAHVEAFRRVGLAAECEASSLRHQLDSIHRVEHTPLSYLQVDEGGRIRVLDVGDIDWIEAAGNYAVLHAGSSTHVYASSLKALQSRLDSSLFVRVHRSTVVNVTRVQEISPWASGDYRLTLRNGTVVRLSRTYRHAFDLLTGKARG